MDEIKSDTRGLVNKPISRCIRILPLRTTSRNRTTTIGTARKQPHYGKKTNTSSA